MTNETRMIFLEAVKQIKSEGWNMDSDKADEQVIKRMESLRRIKNKADKLWCKDVLTMQYTAKHTVEKLATGFAK